MTGKHARKSDSRTKKIAITGALGLGGALVPMTFASTAHAATQDQWDRITACEASGDWNINYSYDGLSVGGLQFQNPSWHDALAYLREQGVDTSAYPPDLYQGMPDVPSRHQQIMAGEALLALQGPGAWVCNGSDVFSSSSDSMFRGGPDPFAGSDDTSSTPPPSTPPPSSDDGGDSSQWTATYTVVQGDSLSSIAAGFGLADWHTLYDANKAAVGADPDSIDVGLVLHVPWQVPYDPTVGGAPGDGGNQGDGTYVVQPGDTLQDIALAHGGSGDDAWRALYAANKDVVGADPDLILPGQVLTLTGAGSGTGGSDCQTSQCPGEPTPPPTDNGQYTVKAGDTLWGLSFAFNVTVDDLMAWNHLTSDLIVPGQVLTVVDPGGSEGNPPADAGGQPTTPPPAQHAGYAAPVDAPVGTAYGVPGNWQAGYHTGVDFLAAYGDPIHAASDGTVVYSGSGGGAGGAYGNQVIIRDTDGTYTLYAHMSQREAWAGQTVQAGDEIGKVGATGNATGPHLHFEVRNDPYAYYDGNFQDPVAWLASHGVHVN